MCYVCYDIMILNLLGPSGYYCRAIYWDSGRLCHEITVYMLPAFTGWCFLPQGECDMIFLFLMC